MAPVESLKRFIESELVPDVDVALEDDLLTTELIDSVGVMMLIDYIEEELGFTVPQEDVTFENFQSISAMGTYLDRAQSEKTTA